MSAGDAGDFRVLGDSASAWFDAPTLTAAAALVSRIAEQSDLHGMPDFDLRPDGVRVRIGATRSPVLTQPELALARAVSATAPELGLAANPSALQTVGLAIETVDVSSVLPFWGEVLGYERVEDDGLRDPVRRDPAVSFHRHDQPRPLRNRIHVDVVRPPEAVEAVKGVVGGDAYGRWELTLADAEGNEVDLVPGDELPGGLETADWRALFAAMTYYPTTSPVQAGRLAMEVAALADDAGVPLLVDLRPDGVTIDSGKDAWDDEHAGETRFAELAGRIQAAAHDLSLSADPTRLRFVQLGVDAVDVPAVRAFWTTVLGYRHDPRTYLADIYDPRRANPGFIFQQMDASEEDRRRQPNRIRLDLLVPSDQSQARIDAALAAGGTVVADHSPGRCRVADPEGNEVDLVTEP